MKLTPRLSPVPIYDPLLIKDSAGNWVLSSVWQNWFLAVQQQVAALQKEDE